MGLRHVAEAYRDEVRQRIAQLKGGKDRDRDKVSLEAWQEMWDLFRPVVERLEAEGEKTKRMIETAREEAKQAKALEPTFLGYQGDVDDLIDPDYTETDSGARIRDAYLWVGEEFRRVCTDLADSGAVMHFGKAKAKPPTPLAVQIAEFYGANPAKREGLLAKLTTFATKDTPQTDSDATQATTEGFLDRIG
jgi:hypothetical protein